MNKEEFCSIIYTAIDTLQEGIQILDENGTYLYLNATAAAHGKSTPEELVGKKLTEIYPGTETTEMYRTLQRCLETKQPQQMLNQFTFPDGSIGWFKLSFQPVEKGVMILSMDVTDMQTELLKRKEAELHRAKNQPNV